MFRSLFLLVLALALPAVAGAAESNVVSSPRASVSIVSDTDAADSNSIKLGLLFRLQPDWHIYWSDPGDAGEAPSIQLVAPPGSKAGPFSYPAPSWLQAEGVGDYVETGTVLLPFTLTLPSKPDASGVAINARANWLVCNPKICVPESGHFSLKLPFGVATPSAERPLFAAAARAEPRPSPFTANISPEGRLTIVGAGLTQRAVASAHFYPFSSVAIDNSAQQKLSFIDNGFILHLRMPLHKSTSPLRGVLEITDPTGEIQALRIDAKPGAAPYSSVSVPFVVWIGAALLGGLILNLMPCVFPVLAMKALAIARLGTNDRRRARHDSLAYSAGAVIAMLALGALLLILRAGGLALGWGFQFQSPLFIAAITWLVFVIGLNFAGLFEFYALENLGSGLAARGDLLGSFATGLLAVIVATPCTAPFMGGAIAAALAAPPLPSLSIFAALGFGISLPFMLLAAIPTLGRVLPRPGPWMVALRQFMAFPMFATAIWLVWVMATEAGAAGVLIVGIGALLIAFALWLLRFHGLLFRGLALIAGIAALLLLLRITPVAAGEQTASITGAVAFSPAKLEALRAAGKPVFVDMSAAWCITCQVNERVALEPDIIRKTFAARGITLMQGDWTRRAPDITKFLAQYHRDGVPLYIYFPPDHAPPKLLPQILTPGIVNAAIGTAQS